MNETPAHPQPLPAPPDFGSARELALTQLAAFTEDPVSARAFELRFLPLALVIALLCFGSIYFIVFRGDSVRLGSAVFLTGFALCIVAAIRIRRAVPVSRLTGRPMLCFHRSDRPHDRDEMLYVDLPSRTYFSRELSVSS